MEVRAGNGLVVRVGDDGTVRVGWREPDWFGPAVLSRAGRPAAAAGADRAQRQRRPRRVHGHRLALAGRPRHGSVRAYRDHPLIVLRLAAPDGLAGGARRSFEPCASPGRTSIRSADRRRAGADARSFAHQWSEFACRSSATPTGIFAPHRPPVVSPFLLIAPDGHAAPRAVDPSTSRSALPRDADALDGGVACGWHGDLDEPRRDSRPSWRSGRRRRCVARPMGAALPARRYRPTLALRRRRPRAPLVLDDNGATYYYRTAGARLHDDAGARRRRLRRAASRSSWCRSILVLSARAPAPGERRGRADRPAQRPDALGAARDLFPTAATCASASAAAGRVSQPPLRDACPTLRHAAWVDGASPRIRSRSSSTT